MKSKVSSFAAIAMAGIVTAGLSIGAANAAMPPVCNDILNKALDKENKLPVPEFTDEDIKQCISYVASIEVDYILTKGDAIETNPKEIANRISQLSELKVIFYTRFSFVQ